MILGMILSCNALQGSWDPQSCFEDNSEVCLSDVNEKKFQQLKVDVKAQLKDSWCSEEKINLLMDLVLLTKPQTCVEIGAFTGSSVLPVAATLQYLKRGKIFAIDAWSAEIAIRNMENNDPNKAWWAKVNMHEIYARFKQMCAKWGFKTICKPIRNLSSVAIQQIPDSIDFLHLDGDYSEVGSTEDVELYLPKVKSGGYVLVSNLYTTVNNKQPKLKSFCLLFDSCEIVAEIENDNAVLFRKN